MILVGPFYAGNWSLSVKYERELEPFMEQLGAFPLSGVLSCHCFSSVITLKLRGE